MLRCPVFRHRSPVTSIKYPWQSSSDQGQRMIVCGKCYPPLTGNPVVLRGIYANYVTLPIQSYYLPPPYRHVSTCRRVYSYRRFLSRMRPRVGLSKMFDNIPTNWPGGLWNIRWRILLTFDYFPSGNNRKTVIWWHLTMTGDSELMAGDPAFVPGSSSTGYCFHRGGNQRGIYMGRMKYKRWWVSEIKLDISFNIQLTT